jgi:hypothetical protein
MEDTDGIKDTDGIMEDTGVIMEDIGVIIGIGIMDIGDIGVMDGTAIRGHIIGHGVIAIGGGNWET